MFKTWQWKSFWMCVGFDRTELLQVKFTFDLCPQHQWLIVGIALLGMSLDGSWCGGE